MCRPSIAVVDCPHPHTVDFGCQKGYFLRYLLVFRQFLIFKFCPVWAFSYQILSGWASHNTMSFFNLACLTSWPWMAVTWHKVIKGLGGYLEVSPTLSMPFHRLCFILIWPGDASDGSQNSDLWPDLDAISDPQIKCCNISEKFKFRATKCRLRIENRSGSLA